MEKTFNILKIESEIANLMADTKKINAEACKTGREASLYQLIAMAAVIGAIVGALFSGTKIFQ